MSVLKSKKAAVKFLRRIADELEKDETEIFTCDMSQEYDVAVMHLGGVQLETKAKPTGKRNVSVFLTYRLKR